MSALSGGALRAPGRAPASLGPICLRPRHRQPPSRASGRRVLSPVGSDVQLRGASLHRPPLRRAASAGRSFRVPGCEQTAEARPPSSALAGEPVARPGGEGRVRRPQAGTEDFRKSSKLASSCRRGADAHRRRGEATAPEGGSSTFSSARAPAPCRRAAGRGPSAGPERRRSAHASTGRARRARPRSPPSPPARRGLRPVVDDAGEGRECALRDLRLRGLRQRELQVDAKVMADAEGPHGRELGARIAEAMHRAARNQVAREGGTVVGVEPVEDPEGLAGPPDQPHRGGGVLGRGQLIVEDPVGCDVDQGQHDRPHGAAVAEVGPEVLRAAVERHPFQRPERGLVPAPVAPAAGASPPVRGGPPAAELRTARASAGGWSCRRAMPIPASLPRPEHPATPALSGSRGRPAAPSSGRRTTPPATRPPAPAVPCGGAGAQARSSRDRRLQPPSNSASTQVCRRRRPRTSPAPKRADPAGTRARPATAAAASSPPAAPPPPAPKGGGHQLRTGRLVMNARRQDRLLRPSLEEAAADGIGGVLIAPAYGRRLQVSRPPLLSRQASASPKSYGAERPLNQERDELRR